MYQVQEASRFFEAVESKRDANTDNEDSSFNGRCIIKPSVSLNLYGQRKGALALRSRPTMPPGTDAREYLFDTYHL